MAQCNTCSSTLDPNLPSCGYCWLAEERLQERLAGDDDGALTLAELAGIAMTGIDEGERQPTWRIG